MKKYIEKSVPLAFVLLLLTTIFAGALFQSCDEDSDASDDSPEIRYVRLTDPEASDSLVTSAFLGTTIALIGEDLGNVQEIWFNDQSAKLNKSYITDETIIVTIPSDIPDEVTNQIRLITNAGKEVTYDFQVDVPKPLLSSMKCEYVPDGETAIIRGNFFLGDEETPLKVTFPGNLEGEIDSYDRREIRVTVPEGAGSGPVTVQSMYGSSTSSFHFRDDRNVFLDFDESFGAGWRPGNTQGSNPEGISGDYLVLEGTISSWLWDEDSFAMNLWGASGDNPRSQGPLFDLDDNALSEMVFKFEVNIPEPWAAGYLQCIFTPWELTDENAYYSDAELARALWRPWHHNEESYQTDGWETVSIPMSDFRFDHEASKNDLSLTYPDDFGGFTFFLWGPALEEDLEQNIFLGIDNVRVVPGN
ncbi:MAG: glycan-binding surface protein [Marinilabiliaceae bacterium]